MPAELLPIVTSTAKSAASTETAKPLRDAVGSTLADVWQGIVGDRVAAWRLKNAASINEKLVTQLAKNGAVIDRSKVSDRYAFTWFEEASKQDEPEIQELFATLLANAANGSVDALERRNLEIVARMTPKDAELLNIIIAKLERRPTLFDSELVTFRWRESYFLDMIKREYGFTDLIALENLQRLGIVDRDLELNTMSLEDHITQVAAAIDAQSSDNLPQLIMNDLVDVSYSLTLSLTGYSLARALSPQSFPDNPS